jgi:opacity protein-like surface antigen
MTVFMVRASILLGASMACNAVFSEDLVEKEPIAHTASQNHHWTGIYGGFNVGAVKHTMSVTDNQATTFYATLQEVSNPNFTGGLQLGYRRQLSQSPVSGLYGLEFVADFANTTFKQVYGSPYALYELSAENELKNVCLLQLMGGIAVDKTLLFLAAGLSWTNLTGSMVSEDTLPYFRSFNANKQAFGTALGGGIEYALNKAISARFKLDVITPNAYLAFDDIGDDFQITNSIVQGTFGINYKFG